MAFAFSVRWTAVVLQMILLVRIATSFSASRRTLAQRCLTFSSSSLRSSSTDEGRETLGEGENLGKEVSALDWQHVRLIAEDAARHAGVIMKQTTGRISVMDTKANVKDLVTESDVACQQIIQQIVESVYPDSIFLGEEDVASGREASVTALEQAIATGNSGDAERLVWIVDPIDGTTNFQSGIPLFAASIGVLSVSPNAENPELRVGVIFNPILDEMISAVQNEGAFLNGKPLESSSGDGCPLHESMVNVGFPISSEGTLRASSRACAALSTKVRGMRMIASAAQVLSWVAQDKVQAYVSWNLNAWDIAAGMLIVQEAGGKLLNFDGTDADVTSRDMVMCSPSGGETLGKEILQILEDKDCLEYTL